ncbi:MAG: NadS family protein [Agitococcus sp.]
MHTDLFNELTQSLKEATAIAKGEIQPSRRFVLDTPDVKAVREKTGLSQAEFALRLHVSARTLQNWEQNRRTPTGAAAALIRLLNARPDVIEDFAALG